MGYYSRFRKKKSYSSGLSKKEEERINEMFWALIKLPFALFILLASLFFEILKFLICLPFKMFKKK